MEINFNLNFSNLKNLRNKENIYYMFEFHMIDIALRYKDFIPSNLFFLMVSLQVITRLISIKNIFPVVFISLLSST